MRLLLNYIMVFLVLSGWTSFGELLAQKVKFTIEEQQWIDNHPTVLFGYEPNWEPYEIYNDGTYEGIVGEYVNILAEATGINFKPIPDITWEKTISGLKDGSIMMAPSCAKTPVRKGFLNFTKTYINDPLVVVTRKDYEPISQLSDLKGKKVALPKSYYTSELINSDYPNIHVVEEKSIQKALESLTYGSVDAFVGNLGVVNYYMYNKGFTNIKVVAPTYFSKEGGGIALATTKKEPVLRDIAEKVFQSIPAKQNYEIRAKWLDTKLSYGVPWSAIIKWIIIAAIIVIPTIGLLYYWNKTLRKYIRAKKKSEHQLKESLVEIKKQDNEKKILLQEIHHRVKNNLQVVSSMIRLQAGYNKDPEASRTLHEADERIKTIALVHEKIYQSPNLDEVSLEEYSRSLIDAILINFPAPKNLVVKIEASNVSIHIDYIVPFALTLNELVTNSVKYAFDTVEKPVIVVNIERKENILRFRYFDNGHWKQNPDSDTFGSTLIQIFTEQLDGKFTLNKESHGTEYLFDFKIDK